MPKDIQLARRIRGEQAYRPTTKNKHFSPFQDQPHTPKGVDFEKLKDLY